MNTIHLEMNITAGEAMRLWSEVHGDPRSAAPKKAAFWKRYTILRNRESRGGTTPPEPVSYAEGASGPTPPLIREPEPGSPSGKPTAVRRETVPPEAASNPPRTAPKPARAAKAAPIPTQPKTANTMKKHGCKPDFTAEEAKAIGLRVRDACSALGYDVFRGISALAQKMDCAGPDLSSLRTGNKVTVGMLERFVSATGARLEWLRTGEGEMLGAKPVHHTAGEGDRRPAKPAKPKTKPAPAPVSPRVMASRLGAASDALRESDAPPSDPLAALVEELLAETDKRTAAVQRIREICAQIATLR